MKPKKAYALVRNGKISYWAYRYDIHKTKEEAEKCRSTNEKIMPVIIKEIKK